MMSVKTRSMAAVLFCLIAGAAAARGDQNRASIGSACTRGLDDYFTREVWPKVASRLCLSCHTEGGDAEGSRLVLQDPQKVKGEARGEAFRHNREAFVRMARTRVKDQSRLLLKVSGGLKHGGADVLEPGSTGYLVLAELVRRLNTPPASLPAVDDRKLPPFFDGVAMMEPRPLLRRVTLSLAGRLPTEAENSAVAARGLDALPPILDGILKEDAFYDRLREAFNDIFLTLGIDGNADQTVLSYEHFEKTRLWYQTYDLSHIKDKNERQRTEWKMAADYRTALLGEPMKLVEYIVRNDRPFTEIVTADYILVSPYSARGYGVFEQLKAKFKNPGDPLEYIPVKLKALKGRSRATDQESATGDYPHAGLLSTFQYLRRYPTTETNRNRLRVRMFYLHFLGVDALELAARVSDAAAVTAKYPIPTMQASECVVCHKTIDPVAGCFQDYYDIDGVYGRRKDGWYRDMFAAGFEGEKLPAKDRWRALQWLGQRTAKDPRFAVAMVEHVYFILFGRKVLLPPKDLDDPLYRARRRAYQEQRRQIEALAAHFTKTGFNLKTVFKDWVLSDFYRADHLARVSDPQRQAELADVGIHRLLSPEHLERKVNAIFGQPWGRLQEQVAILYGGIDSKEVTERASDPSGAMGAIQRTLSNDVAARHTLRDFMLPPARRRLFPGIEPSVLPGSSPEADRAIRRAIVHLHERVLGRHDALDSAEVSRTFDLFAGIIADARARKNLDPHEIYHARANIPNAPTDLHYTIRAWRGVLTYLLRRPEFLYE
jgi:hypothetical protein